MRFVLGSDDETLIDLDSTTGLVLRTESFLDGAMLRLVEATHILIDASVDDALFTEQPPVDATVELSPRMAEPIETVARDAPFTVLAPKGRRLTGLLDAKRPGRPVVVQAHAMPDFAAMRTQRTPGVIPTLQLTQSGEPSGVADPAEWEPISLADGPGYLWQASDDGEVHVLVVRHGTHVWLRGLVDRNETIAAAESLEPVAMA